MDQIASIQVLRAIAALSIVALHVGGGVAPFVTNAGVDLFFVISGFVMVYSSANLFGAYSSAGIFAVRRIARIVPLYWLVTAFFVWMFSLPGVPVLKTLLFIPYLNASGAWLPIGDVGWTLNYEMLFYAIFTAAVVLPRRLAVFSVVGVIGLVALAGHLVRPSGILGFWSKPIILEFAFGCLLGFAYLEGVRLPRAVAVILFVAAAAALASLWMRSEWVRPFVWGLPAAAIVAGACLVKKPWDLGDFAKPFQLLGDASYALYLVHIPVLVITLERGYSRATIFWITLAVAIIAHVLVEKPIIAMVRDATRRPRRQAAEAGPPGPVPAWPRTGPEGAQ